MSVLSPWGESSYSPQGSKSSTAPEASGTEDFPSLFSENLNTAFKKQEQWIFPKIETRRALDLPETGTHPASPPQHSGKGLVLLLG